MSVPSELEVVQATPPAVQRKNSTSSTPLPRSVASATTVNGSASEALTKPRSTGVVKADGRVGVVDDHRDDRGRLDVVGVVGRDRAKVVRAVDEGRGRPRGLVRRARVGAERDPGRAVEDLELDLLDARVRVGRVRFDRHRAADRARVDDRDGRLQVVDPASGEGGRAARVAREVGRDHAQVVQGVGDAGRVPRRRDAGPGACTCGRALEADGGDAAAAGVGRGGVEIDRALEVLAGVVHRRDGRDRVDDPRVRRGGGIDVSADVRRPDVERVRALAERGVVPRARARNPCAAVDAALERGARLVGRVGEGRVGVRVRGRRRGVDRGLRRNRVDGERARRGRLDVAGGVDRAHADRVVAVGREVRPRERERPGSRSGCGAPVLGAVREGGPVPVERVGHALERDLDAVEADAVRGGAGRVVPAGAVVGAAVRREGDRRARRRQVDRPGLRRGRRVEVPGAVLRARLEGVRARCEPRVALRRHAGAPRAAVEAALEGHAAGAAGEGEARILAVRRVRGTGADRGVGRGGVDREGAARGRLDVAGEIARADADRVAAVGRERGGGEAEVPRGAAGVLPVLGRARERGAVPVEAVGAALDRHLDAVEARAHVGSGAADAARRAARRSSPRCCRSRCSPGSSWTSSARRCRSSR